MPTTLNKRRYRPTESQFKGYADEMYVTYDLEQRTRGGGSAIFPKVKRVYIAGEVKDWKIGILQKRSGREAYGVEIEYQQSRKAYRREGYTAKRGGTTYRVSPVSIKATSQKFRKIVEVPKNAKNIRFHPEANTLPEKYQHALQDVR
jgi:hypothetical protein